MTKALEEIKTLRGFNQVELNNDENINKSLDIIESALQRLEAIDNAKPSEALEELEMLHDCSTAIQELPSSNWVEYAENEAELDLKLYFGYENIKQSLLKSQEQEKVLKIIFEKGLSLVERDMIKQSENYEQYQIKISWWNYKPFAIPKSKEDFELLKRYFNEEKD